MKITLAFRATDKTRQLLEDEELLTMRGKPKKRKGMVTFSRWINMTIQDVLSRKFSKYDTLMAEIRHMVKERDMLDQKIESLGDHVRRLRRDEGLAVVTNGVK